MKRSRYYVYNGEIKKYLPDFLRACSVYQNYQEFTVLYKNLGKMNFSSSSTRCTFGLQKDAEQALIVLDNDITLVLEVKGRLSEQDKEKKSALEDWIKAVNSTRDWGEWHCDISRSAADIDGIIEKHSSH